MANICAVDMGNSQLKSLVSINGKINGLRMPNAIARCLKRDEDIKYYEPDTKALWNNMIVEVNSPALNAQNDRYYVGISATTEQGMSDVPRNHRKTTSDRAMIQTLTMIAYEAVNQNQDKEELKTDIECLGLALPTLQVKNDRELLRDRLSGIHKVKFIKVPRGKRMVDVSVTINIIDVVVGIESALTHIALTRDEKTLKVIHPELMEDALIIADGGGDSWDLSGFTAGRLIEGIEGEVFGINSYLDDIRDEVQLKHGYTFRSRFQLENIIATKPSNRWVVPVKQKRVDIKPIVDTHLTAYAIKYLDSLDKARKNPLLQDALDIFCVGGATKVAKDYIEKENAKKNEDDQLVLTFPDNMDMLNLQGLWILVKMYAQKYHNLNLDSVVASKDEINKASKGNDAAEEPVAEVKA